MNAILAFFNAFRVGSQLANPGAWKTGQISVTLISGFVMALAHFGDAVNVHIPIDTQSADAIAGTILFVVNFLLTPATSTKVGLLPGSASNPATPARTTDDIN